MRRIAGKLDAHALEVLHKPQSDDELAVEARRLAAQGLKPQDIAQAIGEHVNKVMVWLEAP